jgi:branched-chain amino acid transport system substrate-binding protein
VKEFIKGSPVKKWNVIATDYTAGHDAAEKFQSVVEATGGSVNKVLFAPLGTSDFGAHISQLAAAPADGLFVTIFGSDAINLAKQQAQFGLFKQFKMVLGNGFAVPANLPAQGDAVLGVQQTLSYVPEFPGKANDDFVQAYRAKYNEAPNYNLADQYAAVELLREAIVKAGSIDVGAVKSALSGLKAATVLGDVEMRAADHQLVRPITVTEVIKLPSGELGYALKAVESGPSIIPATDPACKL